MPAHYDRLFADPRREMLIELLIILYEEAARAARAAAQERRKHRHALRPPRGRTLRPGADTPLWNQLISQTAPLLVKRGSKAQLARLLGLPRQRLHDCLKARTATLDAERTLLLFCWIAGRLKGRDLWA